MKKEALFSDTTGFFLSSVGEMEAKEVRIRFRTGKDELNEVILVCEGNRITMEKVESIGCFDYYETIYRLGDFASRYYFEIKTSQEIVYYNALGALDTLDEGHGFRFDCYFKVPDWARGCVYYQIYPERFCNGDGSNDVVNGEYRYLNADVVKANDWNENPVNSSVRKFYGGDLQGIIDKLDYLKDLGAEVLYLNPIFVSPSNHKYDAQDYSHIDPHFGVIVKDAQSGADYSIRTADPENLKASDELFAKLCEEVHKRGMKVILDGVFNHCGSFHKWMDREGYYLKKGGYPIGAFWSKESPYRDYFYFFGEKHENEVQDNYEGWWGHSTLPKLNYETGTKVEEEILEIGRKWVSAPYNADGWRLDVAADLGRGDESNHAFWKKFRKAVKEANPDAVILAEHYGNPGAWLCGDEWDTVMNYDAFMEPVSWFLTGTEKHNDSKKDELKGDGYSFAAAMNYAMAHLPLPSLQTAMNQLSNHDHSRFLTRTTGKVGRVEQLGYEAAGTDVSYPLFRMGVIMQMTWVGAPALYYGDEAGVCGFTDPDNRRTYPWGNENKDLIEFHKSAISIHKENSSLQKGSLLILLAEKDIVAYGRFDENETVICVFNTSEFPKEVSIPVWRVNVPNDAILKTLILTENDTWSTDERTYQAVDGDLCLSMPPLSSFVLHWGL
ncbi:MAG: glycoside hydrolase family 13 protein [Lachnospiraceae bacterium]|jgi:alpha-glucosidase|nr:glycoside hydrolase family 13 protein [Lachnospiraceae bacterium]